MEQGFNTNINTEDSRVAWEPEQEFDQRLD